MEKIMMGIDFNNLFTRGVFSTIFVALSTFLCGRPDVIPIPINHGPNLSIILCPYTPIQYNVTHQGRHIHPVKSMVRSTPNWVPLGE